MLNIDFDQLIAIREKQVEIILKSDSRAVIAQSAEDDYREAQTLTQEDIATEARELLTELNGRIDLASVDRELSRRAFIEFVKIAWEHVEPGAPFVHNWHLDVIAEHLEAVAHGLIKRLVINVPPGATKSLLAAVFFPAWDWTIQPSKRFIYACYNDNLSRRDSRRCRALIASDWYQERWGHVFNVRGDMEDTSRRYSNNRGGFRLITSVGGGITGEHADIQIVDDPIKPLEVTGSLAVSKTALERVLSWWRETMSMRMVDHKTSARVIIMQRLHENDLAGAMLREGGYEHLCLPMEFDARLRGHTTLGKCDARSRAGELLDPVRFPRDAVERMKKELGPRGASAQLQQNPTAAGGNLFKRKQLRRYTTIPKCPRLIQSWDCAFKNLESSSFVVGQVWGVLNENFYLLDQIRAHLNVSGTAAGIEQLTKRWPKAVAKLVEDKANGPAVVDMLKRKIPGLKLVTPEGGKEARANAVEPLFDAGNVWIPDPTIAPWIEEYIEELVTFPAGLHDDQVDATTQALSYLYSKQVTRLREAMANVRGVRC